MFDSRIALSALIVLSVAGCGPAQEPPQTEPAAAPETTPKGKSMADILKRVESDEPRDAEMSGIDPAAKNLSPFRGFYAADVRDAYEAKYQELKDIDGEKIKWIAAANQSLHDLGLRLEPVQYKYTLECAAAFVIRGRLGEEKVSDAQMNARMWTNAFFIEIDQRNEGSVAGVPEQIPGIEKFPERKRDFTPDPGVEPYREQTFMSYRFIEDEWSDPSKKSAVLKRAKECDDGLPPLTGEFD